MALTASRYLPKARVNGGSRTSSGRCTLALAEVFEVHQAGAGRDRHKLGLPASVGLPAAYEFTDRSAFKADFGDQTVRVLGDDDGAGVA
jgi:hypothetical protein